MNNYYIPAPSYSVTGGQECLHQLCDSLNKSGKNAFIVYYPDVNAPIPEVYKKYQVQVEVEVKDIETNTIILHESQFDRLYDFKNVKIIFWWLSVDNFFKSSMRYLTLGSYINNYPNLFLKSIVVKLYYLFIRRKNILKRQLSISQLKNKSSIHLCQSVYAEKFLDKIGFQNLFQLNDYINSEFKIVENAQRENIILYNPKKGYKFQKYLIQKFSNYTWVPIINMNYSQISELMNRAKIYVDFGNHPGRDKIPREAVAAGLCIVTGIHGSAFYYGDIPISDEYKFDQENFDDIRFKVVIDRLLENYSVEREKFQIYRNMVSDSEFLFHEQVKGLILNEFI